jgi:hypothetical protein
MRRQNEKRVIMLVWSWVSGRRRRSATSDLHEARDPEREPQIDTVGWLFLAFAIAITAAAAMVAYRANTMIANAPVSQVVAR